MGREGEPWHVGGAGGLLRSIVYGFNDGLTANFGLVAGIIGASVSPHMVIISGLAGALADALSMGSSGYLAAKSEAEVQAHQIEMERHDAPDAISRKRSSPSSTRPRVSAGNVRARRRKR